MYLFFTKKYLFHFFMNKHSEISSKKYKNKINKYFKMLIQIKSILKTNLDNNH